MRTVTNHEEHYPPCHQAARSTCRKVRELLFDVIFVLTLEGDLEGCAEQRISFCLRADSGSSLICCNGALLPCTCSPLMPAMPQAPLSMNNKSGHLTAGHFPSATLTHTSSPGSSLPNLPCLDTKTVACYSEIAL